MGLLANERYTGVVAGGSSLFESQKGTLGFQVMLECDAGETSYTIWLTEKNKARAVKDFETLGVSLDELQDPHALEQTIGDVIVGRTIVFGTTSEEYKGNTTIKVAWIGKSSGAGGLANNAAVFFGGKATPQEDGEVPF